MVSFRLRAPGTSVASRTRDVPDSLTQPRSLRGMNARTLASL